MSHAPSASPYKRAVSERYFLKTSPPPLDLSSSQHCLPLAAFRPSTLLWLAFVAAAPLFILLLPPSLVPLPTTAIMPQDLKKLMPQARATITTPVTAEAPGFDKVEGETIPRRNTKAKDALIMKPSDDVNTLFDLLRSSSAKFGNAKAVGTRKVLDIHEETKKIKKVVDGKEQEVDKKWQYFELSPFDYKSFTEFEKMALDIGAALNHLGFQAGDRAHLYAATSAQWLASAHGMPIFNPPLPSTWLI